MHKSDIRVLANWRSVELHAKIYSGVESLAQTQTLSERHGTRLTPTAYEIIARKLTMYQRAMARMNRIAQGISPFDAKIAMSDDERITHDIMLNSR